MSPPTINVRADVHIESDGVYFDRVTVGSWVVYSAEGDDGLSHDNLYVVRGGECYPLTPPPAAIEAQDIWVIRKWVRSTTDSERRCESCGRKLSLIPSLSRADDPAGLYGVSRSKSRGSGAPRAYVVCMRCVLIWMVITDFLKHGERAEIVLPRTTVTRLPHGLTGGLHPTLSCR
jgi:hypothetical protein